MADAGYDSEENMDWIEKNGSTVCIEPREYEYGKTSAFKKKIGHRSNMAYDTDSDTYTCAKGRKLHFVTETKQRDKTSGYERTVRIYQCENCQYCGKRSQCQPTRTGKKPKQNKMIQYNPYYQSLLDKDYDFIHSKKGIQLRINRSIQIEGAFGTVKGNYEYRRDTDRLQQHYLEKEETHTVAC